MDLQDIHVSAGGKLKKMITILVFLLSLYYLEIVECKPPIYEGGSTTAQAEQSTSGYEPMVLYIAIGVVSFLIVSCCIIILSCCFWWKSKKKERQQLVYRTIYPTYNSDGKTKSPLGLISTDLNTVLEKKQTQDSEFKNYDHLYIAENPNFKFQELAKEPHYKTTSTQELISKHADELKKE